MFQTIRAIDAGVRKATEVSLRKDAAHDYQRGRQEDAPASSSGAVLNFGAVARQAAAGNPVAGAPNQTYGQPLNPVSEQGRNQAGAGTFEVIGRALQSFGAEPPGTSEANQQRAQLRLGPASRVPFEALQRAVSGPPYYEQGSEPLSAFRGLEARSGAESERPIPFDVLQRAASVQAFSGEQDVELSSFEVPEEAGAPFGRDVPFDFLERAAARIEQQGQGAEEQGLSDFERNELEALRDKDRAVQRELARQGEPTTPSGESPNVEYRVGPDGERYAVAARESIERVSARPQPVESRVERRSSAPPDPGSREALRASLAQEAYRAAAQTAPYRPQGADDTQQTAPAGVDARV